MKSYFTLKSVSSKLSLDFCKLEIGLKLKFFAGDVHESADLVDAWFDLFYVTNPLFCLKFFRFEGQSSAWLRMHFLSKFLRICFIEFLHEGFRRIWHLAVVLSF